MNTHIAQFNRFEIELPEHYVNSCSHAGSCDNDVNKAMGDTQVMNQFNNIDAAKIKDELREYGAWDENELSNVNDNIMRIIWIAAGNIKEELYEQENG